MEIKERKLTTSDNVSLYTKLWLPEGYQKAGIIVVHNIGDNSNSYDSIPEYFLKNHFVILTYDLRGHGQSGENKGRNKNYDLLLSDLALIEKYFVKKAPDIPLFIYGHGLGGIIALNHIINENSIVQGILISSLWMKSFKKMNEGEYKKLNIISKLFPYYKYKLKVSDGSVAQNCDESYVFKKVNSAFFKELYDAYINVFSLRYKINVPVLIMHGKKDQIASVNSSKLFASNTNRFTLKIWKDMCHELHNEQDNNRVFDFVQNWLMTIFW